MGEIENRIFREIRWVTRQELLDLDFLEADRGLVQGLRGRENSLGRRSRLLRIYLRGTYLPKHIEHG